MDQTSQHILRLASQLARLKQKRRRMAKQLRDIDGEIWGAARLGWWGQTWRREAMDYAELRPFDV